SVCQDWHRKKTRVLSRFRRSAARKSLVCSILAQPFCTILPVPSVAVLAEDGIESVAHGPGLLVWIRERGAALDGLLQEGFGIVDAFDCLQEHAGGAGVDFVAAAMIAEVVSRGADLNGQGKIRTDDGQGLRWTGRAGRLERFHGKPLCLRNHAPWS